ncbi:MAG TPA: hypothetical protein VFP48_08200 [Steroidobacteraceae bacterium]|nr:hypothetical protein [Steroidobacteraceae bacterium]
MLRGVAVACATLWLVSCGGGDDGHDEPSTHAPVISNLQVSPDFVRQFDGDGRASIGGTFTFSDAGRDLASFTLKTSQGETITADIEGAAGMKSGILSGGLEIDSTVLGDFGFELYVTDREGSRSNTLSGTISVVVNDTAERWSLQSLPVPSGSPLQLWSVVYGGARYVAVGDSIFTSPDATTWTERDPGVVHTLHDVAWTGSRYIAVGDAGTLLTSGDGSDWTLHTIPAVTQPVLNGVAGSPARAVAVGTQGATASDDLILTSTDGVTWTQVVTPETVALDAVTWSGSRFVAVGTDYGGTSVQYVALVSSDGTGWQKHPVPVQGRLTEVIWDGAQFVAAGYGGVARSPDGTTWTQVGPGVAWGRALGSSGERYLLCVLSTCQVSEDGLQWYSTQSLPGVDPHVMGLTWGDTKWVVVGSRGGSEPMVLTSP